MAAKLTHLDKAGAVHMVDVTRKKLTTRSAAAEGYVTAKKQVIRAVKEQALAKGDVLAVARVAGINAVKRTAEIIPLCHPIHVTHAAVDITLEEERFRVECRVTARDSTGVEMEALSGAAAACLTLYDMTKSLDKGMEIGPLRLLEKKGGRSGHWRRI